MSVPSSDPSRQTPAGEAGAAGAGASPEPPLNGEPDTATLIDQLNQDRLWLLRQIDAGRWSEWRLDLAALERELGQLLEQARERAGS